MPAEPILAVDSLARGFGDGEARLELSFTISNLMVAPGEGLPWTFVVDVEILPSGE